MLSEIHSCWQCSTAPLYSVYGVNWGAQKQDLQKPTHWVTERTSSKLQAMKRRFVNYFQKDTWKKRLCPHFIWGHALTKIISCCPLGHLVARGKAKLVCCFAEWESCQILPARRMLFVFASTWKSELCHHSGTLNRKSARAWNSLGAHFPSWAPAAQHWECGRCHLPNPSAANRAGELLVLLSQSGAFLVEEDHI